MDRVNPTYTADVQKDTVAHPSQDRVNPTYIAKYRMQQHTLHRIELTLPTLQGTEGYSSTPFTG